MNGKVCWGLAVLTMIGAAAVAGEPGVVVIRGQSPTPIADKPATTAPVATEAYGPLIGSAPGYGELKKYPKKGDFKVVQDYHDHHYGYNGGYYVGPEGYYAARGKKIYTTGQGHGHGGEGCPHCQYGNSCPADGCPHCSLGKDKPTHYTTYGYKWPQNMVYPQYGAPAAAVQYPYYTFRGPTDFFMK